MKNLIKNKLVELAKNDQLPQDMNELNPDVFNDLNAEGKHFPNGFTSWMEAHHEIVKEIHLNGNSPLITEIMETQGTGGLFELSEALTDEFEKKYEGHIWDGEWYETIEAFFKEKSNK